MAYDADAQAKLGALRAAQGNRSADVSTGSQVINTAQAYLELTGALAADATITLSAANRMTVKNSTTGAYKLWIRRGASGVALMIPQNEAVEVR
jgi:hypothetical protein